MNFGHFLHSVDLGLRKDEQKLKKNIKQSELLQDAANINFLLP